jgi:hypothetical protein
LPGPSSAITRQQLLETLDSLSVPEARSFSKIAPPPSSELKSYRIVEDRTLRTKLANVGLVAIVQSPGQGNWTKSKAPPYIAKVYPNFDAPQEATPTAARATRSSVSKMPLPAALVHDLRTKWESYYVDSRPESQRRHEQRAQTMDVTAMAARAKELLAEARRAGRPMSPRDALLRATDELTADFETAMRRKYGDIVVDLLGIPDATDTRLAS